jgi:hypothetical protein
MTISLKNCRTNRQVDVWRIGHTISVDPAIPELAIDFRTIGHRPVQRAGCVSMERYQMNLARVDWDDEMLLAAGLGDFVVEKLQRLGYQVNDIDRYMQAELRRLPKPRALDSLISEPFDRTFLKLIRDKDRGLIRYNSTNVSPARLIGQTALAYPKARIVCAVTRIDEPFELRRQLRRWVKRERILALNHRHNSDASARIVVGTYACLGGGAGDLHNRDILFALSPTEMLVNEYGNLSIRNADQSRVFGFLPRETNLTTLQRIACVSLFGPDELVIPRHGQTQRPITAVMLPVHGGPHLPKAAPIHELLKGGVWHHPVRNRRIARLAEAIAVGDFAALESFTNNRLTVELLQGHSTATRIGILCGPVEQALELCRLLPGWRLVTGKPVRTGGLSPDQLELLRYARRQPSRPNKGFVVTEAGLSRIRRCDVIIRADAGVAEIPTDWAKSTRGSFPPRAALVIDFLDHHHAQLRRRTQRRRRAYLNAGWRLPAEFPNALDQFTATIPQLELE